MKLLKKKINIIKKSNDRFVFINQTTGKIDIEAKVPGIKGIFPIPKPVQIILEIKIIFL